MSTPLQPVAADLDLYTRKCTHCRYPIMWTKTEASGGQEWMPLDAEPARNGNVIVKLDARYPGRLISVVVASKRDQARLRSGGWFTFVHHRVSCPQAEEWSRRAGAGMAPTGRVLTSRLPTTDTGPKPEQGTLL